jgi:hypothetical protein
MVRRVDIEGLLGFGALCAPRFMLKALAITFENHVQ